MHGDSSDALFSRKVVLSVAEVCLRNHVFRAFCVAKAAVEVLVAKLPNQWRDRYKVVLAPWIVVCELR